MKKKIFIALILAVIVTGITACQKKSAPAANVTETVTEKTEEAADVQDTEKARKEEPADAPASDPAEGQELILECDSDTNVRVIVPAIFTKINNESYMTFVFSEDEKLHASYMAGPQELEYAFKEITEQTIKNTRWEDCDEEPYISDREEQDMHGQKCLWHKITFSMDGEKYANIFGNMGSEDGESSISIMLFAEGEDAVNIVDDTWQKLISGIEFQ